MKIIDKGLAVCYFTFGAHECNADGNCIVRTIVLDNTVFIINFFIKNRIVVRRVLCLGIIEFMYILICCIGDEVIYNKIYTLL